MSFDPNKEFDVVDQFDPDQPFETLDEDQGPGILDSIMDSALVEGVKDVGIGAAQGALMGFGDEALAGIMAAAGQGDYRELQQEYEQDVEAARERSPYLTGAGEIGGGILSALATGGAGMTAKGAGLAAKAAQAAKMGATAGAAYGAGESKGKLIGATPEEMQELAKDVGIGTASGAAFGAAGEPLTHFGGKAVKKVGDKVKQKASDIAENWDFLRAVKKDYELGEQGIKLSPGDKKRRILEGHKSGSTVSKEMSDNIVDDIIAADKEISGGMGVVLDEADEAGIILDLGESFSNSIDSIEKNLGSLAETGVGELSGKINSFKAYLNSVKKSLGKDDLLQATPRQAKDIMNKLDTIYDEIGEGALGPEIIQLRKDLNQTLRDKIPGYAQVADDLNMFRSEIQENIIEDGLEKKYRDRRYSDMPGKEKKLRSAFGSGVVGKLFTSNTAKASDDILEGIGTYLKNADPKILKALGVDSAEEFLTKITDAADVHHALSIAGVKTPLDPERATVSGTIWGQLIGRGSEFIGKTANRMGMKGVGNKVSNMSRALFNAPKESIARTAVELQKVPGLKAYGEKIQHALENNDRNGLNAALFVLMQKPEARKYLYGKDDE